MKTCNKCGVEKELTEFSKNNHIKDGLQSRCRQCCSEAQAAYKATPTGADAIKRAGDTYYAKQKKKRLAVRMLKKDAEEK